MAKVTVALATYNGEKYLEEQLNSILNQQFKDFKILICDDVSTDNTYSILKKYQQKFPEKIELFQNKKRLGVVKNFEKLIEMIDSDYIALCDQDDIWYENKLLKAMSFIEKNTNSKRAQLFHSDLRGINSRGEVIYNSFFKKRGYTFSKEKQLDSMLGRSGVMGNTMVFNQALKKKVLPFPPKLIVHDYWIALVNEIEGERLSYSEPLIDYRIHETNTSTILRNQKNCSKNIILPYHNINREFILEVFLKRFTLEEKEKIMVQSFLEYLSFKKSRFYFISLLFKYNFFRVGVKYKFKLIGAIILNSRSTNQCNNLK